MPRKRTWDVEEAKRLKSEGKKRSEIAEILGVSEGAIEWAIDPDVMKNYAQIRLRLPPDMKRAIERYAVAEHRSVNSQLIHILKEVLDWRWYEEDEDTALIFAHPVARYRQTSSIQLCQK